MRLNEGICVSGECRHAATPVENMSAAELLACRCNSHFLRILTQPAEWQHGALDCCQLKRFGYCILCR